MLMALLLLAGEGSARAQAPSDALATIDALKCRKQQGSVTLSYRVKGAMGPEVRSTLESGITVTFVHRLTVVRRRALFFDKSLAHKTIEVSATFDTLTQQYTLNRNVDGVRSISSTDRLGEVERWLSDVHDVSIPLPPEGDKGTIELRVKTEYQTNYYVLWVLPWSLSAKDDKECR